LQFSPPFFFTLTLDATTPWRGLWTVATGLTFVASFPPMKEERMRPRLFDFDMERQEFLIAFLFRSPSSSVTVTFTE
jgi:hypothetical protein